MKMPSILVVDDDDTLRSIVAKMFALAGYEVSQAGNGVEALDILEQDTPDLILSDLEMPELDGFSLYRQLRARGCQIPFIGMSGRLCEADGGESRFDAFLSKPFKMQTLIDTVEGVLIAQPVY